MKLSFYPGCSLEGLAIDYARSIDAVFQALDIDLVEIDDWSCCGATAAHSLSEAMSVILPARNLSAAEQMGLDIVSPCANCFNRLRFSQQMIQKRVLDIPWPVTGDLKIHDMTRFLAEPTMIKQIKKRILKPLKGLKLVCYYGCQMVRPPRITGYTDYENPQTLDRILANGRDNREDGPNRGRGVRARRREEVYSVLLGVLQDDIGRDRQEPIREAQSL